MPLYKRLLLYQYPQTRYIIACRITIIFNILLITASCTVALILPKGYDNVLKTILFMDIGIYLLQDIIFEIYQSVKTGDYSTLFGPRMLRLLIAIAVLLIKLSM